MTASQKLGEKMYADMQAAGGPEAAAAAAGAGAGPAHRLPLTTTWLTPKSRKSRLTRAGPLKPLTACRRAGPQELARRSCSIRPKTHMSKRDYYEVLGVAKAPRTMTSRRPIASWR
jgi:hypothetical protein